ncbi:ABC transporter type 1, transmembrane domain containing protein [Parasponia andersonii]|uniref:ABC transporter type 1, transmembrane domain containing protein n=1 Tax=Parasponia andersonii TaxID=3476 RepID=A0A2P5AAI0_PARAD|nr:ABC transporter type 1, transmembrane domain containing protein [Parasponia andersonii]
MVENGQVKEIDLHDELIQQENGLYKSSFISKEWTKPKIGKNLIILHMLPEWKQASLGCLSAILFGAIQPLYAAIMGTTISMYFSTDHDEIKDRIKKFDLCFLGLSLFSILISLSQHNNFAYMGENLIKRIRERMLSKILSFEIGWFDRDNNFNSVICSRLTKYTNVVKSLMSDRISLLV